MGVRFIKISVVYFVIGTLLGMYMSMTYNFQFTGTHAHVNLLGWTSMTLAGILYVMYPKAGKSMLGKIHFWLHNIGLPIMMVCLFLTVLTGNQTFASFIGVGGVMVVIAVILFAINIFRNVR
ncbi:cytochrome-c oxidase [Alkalihalophilus pseudofirmus]|uniref:Cytochrome-c oxidase n=1 Tax=Alkalihalophilus pseudofirmus TaxID=79885 RepID=A0AAJ2NQT1_ALKPS|nr:cytochrome-c oxidase [Alkalihalophilus pseudofirmus]MDV2886940.1 cytochrome-c oxidase [Alkalihalophilus pseudofirmus]WEG16839.1 cytochrome-c oxidase [Alkalihalophilus pseudofirmus]